MFWGLAIGDALGAPLEYSNKPKWSGLIGMDNITNQSLSLGQVTDDTELTISLLDSIITYNNSIINSEKKKISYPLYYDEIYSFNNYSEWTNSNPPEISHQFQYLFETENRFDLFEKENEINNIKYKWNKYKLKYNNYYEDDMINWSTDNSCLIRASPLVFCNIKDALTDCKLTHKHPICEDGVSLYIQILKNCLTTNVYDNYDKNLTTALVPDDIKNKEKTRKETSLYCSTEELKRLIRHVLKRNERRLDVHKSDILTTLYCGLNCYAFFDKFETAMNWVIGYHLDQNLGLGDCDSNASICGAIMGAKIGFRAMLQEYKTNFNYNIVSTITTERPHHYQPSKRLNYLINNLIHLIN
jgi:ADP-ribosylglycohydrolase